MYQTKENQMTKNIILLKGWEINTRTNTFSKSTNTQFDPQKSKQVFVSYQNSQYKDNQITKKMKLLENKQIYIFFFIKNINNSNLTPQKIQNKISFKVKFNYKTLKKN